MTNGYKINTGPPSPPHILIAPLDWGLGHVTRCIPIIKLLIDKGCRITLAAAGRHAQLLRLEFPNVELVPLSGYNLTYSASGRKTMWKIIFQLPKILTAIKQENRWLATYLAGNKPDMIISDCRFGLHHQDVFCVLITHQLRIASPFAKWMERWLQKWNYHFIEKFDQCWIPDFEGDANLAGELSHPARLPRISLKYIGGLSRLSQSMNNDPEIQYDVLIILSGPEPQRTVLEKIMLKELASYDGKAALVRGLPDESNAVSIQGVAIFNHLPSAELSLLIMNSNIVISRSGYTTVMDLVKLRKKSVLIPTPGQTEQEYLGKYLMQQQLCVCVEQHVFSLKNALREAGEFSYVDIRGFDMELYKTVIELVLEKRER